jgi:hypothetical protein
MRRAFIPTFHRQPEPNEHSTAYADDDERESPVIPVTRAQRAELGMTRG